MPKYTITNVYIKLDFELESVNVTAELSYNLIDSDPETQPTLTLRGKNLLLHSVYVDDNQLNSNDYNLSTDQSKLTIFKLQKQGLIRIQNTANISSDIKLGGLIALTPEIVLTNYQKQGLENITYFIRDQIELIYFKTELSTKFSQYTALIAPGQQISKIITDSSEQIVTWQALIAQHPDHFLICAIRNFKIFEVHDKSSETFSPTIRIYTPNTADNVTARISNTLRAAQNWFTNTFCINSKYQHYTIVGLPINFEYAQQQHNLLLFDVTTLMCSGAEDIESRTSNLQAKIASNYFISQYSDIDPKESKIETKKAIEQYYKTHFDLASHASCRGYGSIRQMYFDYINISLDQMQHTSFIEMPINWIQPIQQILFDQELPPTIRSYLLTLPHFHEIVAQRTTSNLDHLANLYMQIHNFIANNLIEDFFEIFSRIVSGNDFFYSIEYTHEYDLIKICLHYLLLCNTQEVQKELIEHLRNDSSISKKVCYFEVLMQSPVLHKNKFVYEAMTYMLNLYSQKIITGRLFFACMALDCTELVYKNIYAHLQSSKHSYYDKYILVSTFAINNFKHMHSICGNGYRLIANAVIIIDRDSPELACKLLEILDDWPKFDNAHKKLIYKEWENIIRYLSISDQVFKKIEHNIKIWKPITEPTPNKESVEYKRMQGMLRNFSLQKNKPQNKADTFMQQLTEEYSYQNTATSLRPSQAPM